MIRKTETKEVSSSTLKASLRLYLDRVEKGATFRISRRGKIVAVLLPCDVFERLMAAIPSGRTAKKPR